ncbi:hypothetical protein DEO72_LG2g133 [Vigna unguiculata]|uniref:Transmembrane protein n=1 Tax=Vigna unguiculata TaxID=3917 RepID=A0A4D6KTI0_VIGUN|nr:hypothetical protein DEO72_LG2g133 [Vigna unguiculata]
MDATKMVVQYKYHITIAIAFSLSLSFMLYAAPRITTILAYFWPLFASTAVLLAAIIAFGGVSKFSTEDHGHGEKAGEGLLDYVTSLPQHTEEPPNF